MKRIIIIITIIALLIILKLLFFSGKEDLKQAGKQGMSKVPLSVQAFVVKPEKMENKLFVTGTMLANEEVELIPEISGKVLNIIFEEGSSVEKGQLLLKINDADLQAQLKKLKAQEDFAKEKESRLKQLMDINGISKEEYETSMNTLQSLQADIEFTLAQIAKTEIHAPFSGLVGLRNVSEGAYVSIGTRIAAIQQLDPLKIDFSIPEKYASLIQKGSVIRFSVEGTIGIFEGKIIAIEPKIDVETRTIKIRAVCPNHENKILPGAFAKIEILLKGSENSMMIPTQALIPELKGYKVFISKNGIAEEVQVITGLRTEKLVQVLEGLSPGDTVLTSGIMQLKNGSAIKILNE